MDKEKKDLEGFSMCQVFLIAHSQQSLHGTPQRKPAKSTLSIYLKDVKSQSVQKRKEVVHFSSLGKC